MDKEKKKTREYVWFFGSSASGKMTAINRAIEDFQVREKFDLSERCCVFKPSMYRNLIPNNPSKIPLCAEDILGYKPDYISILIKAQFTDLFADSPSVPEDLKKLDPEANHRIILLICDNEENFKRVSSPEKKRMQSPGYKPTPESLLHEESRMRELADKYEANEFKVLRFNNLKFP